MAKRKKIEPTQGERQIVGYKVTFPKEAANDRNPETREKSVSLSNSLEIYHIPVEREVIVPPMWYRALKDIAFKFLPAVDEPVFETAAVATPAVEEPEEVKEEVPEEPSEPETTTNETTTEESDVKDAQPETDQASK